MPTLYACAIMASHLEMGTKSLKWPPADTAVSGRIKGHQGTGREVGRRKSSRRSVGGKSVGGGQKDGEAGGKRQTNCPSPALKYNG